MKKKQGQRQIKQDCFIVIILFLVSTVLFNLHVTVCWFFSICCFYASVNVHFFGCFDKFERFEFNFFYICKCDVFWLQLVILL